MDKSDLVLKAWEQSCTDMRQMDAQRTTLSNIILVLGLAIIGVLTKTQAEPFTVFLASLLLLLGVFGVFSVGKYYERYRYYKNRAESLMEELSKTVGIDVPSILEKADKLHVERFKLRVSVKVYRVWYLVHGIVLASGLYFLYAGLCS